MDTSTAAIMTLAAMLLWGSWANTILLAKTRFELFVLDFMIGHFLSALIQVSIAAPTLLSAVNAGLYGGAVFGICIVAGALYSLAMLLSIAACSLAGMALSTVLVLGIETALGTPLLMLVNGAGTALHVWLTLAGIVAVLVATLFDYKCHAQLERDRGHMRASGGHMRASSLSVLSFRAVATLSEDLKQQTSNTPVSPSFLTHTPRKSTAGEKSPQASSRSLSFGTTLRQPMELVAEEAPAASMAHEQSPGSTLPTNCVGSARFGMVLAAVSGMCFSIWPIASSIVEGQSRAGNPFGTAKLEATSFFIVYAASSLLSCLIFLPHACHRPIHNAEPLAFWPSYREQSMWVHFLGVVGGVMHGVGTVLSLQAGDVLGNTISVSILRCHPLIVSLWGVTVWKELAGARRVAVGMFVCMLLMFIAAVALFLVAGL